MKIGKHARFKKGWPEIFSCNQLMNQQFHWEKPLPIKNQYSGNSYAKCLVNKNKLKMKEILNFKDFQPIWGCFGNINGKIKNYFPRLNSLTCFCCHYGISKNNDLLPNRQNFLRGVHEISFKWFWLVSLLKRMHLHDTWLSK